MVILFNSDANVPLTYKSFNDSTLDIYLKAGNKYDTTELDFIWNITSFSNT